MRVRVDLSHLDKLKREVNDAENLADEIKKELRTIDLSSPGYLKRKYGIGDQLDSAYSNCKRIENDFDSYKKELSSFRNRSDDFVISRSIWGQIVDGVGEFYHGSVDGMKEVSADIWGGTVDAAVVVGETYNEITEKVEDIAESISEKFDHVKDTAMNAINDAGEFFCESIDDAVEFIKDVAEPVISTVEEWIEGALNWLDDNWQDIESAILEILEAYIAVLSYELLSAWGAKLIGDLMIYFYAVLFGSTALVVAKAAIIGLAVLMIAWFATYATLEILDVIGLVTGTSGRDYLINMFGEENGEKIYYYIVEGAQELRGQVIGY